MGDIRTLLLTDVVDSTRVAEALGDPVMEAHWVAHDRAARDLLSTWRGREIERTDGLLAVFDAAADAVCFALAYHRALTALALPFKARAGIHVGPLTLRESSALDVSVGAKRFEVGGLAVPVAARVMGAALGGQTLLSPEARLALGDFPLRLQSHGHWRLKGIREPVELFEVGDARSAFMPPPDSDKAYRVVRNGELWLPVREIKHSVPAERDLFVGRHEPLLQLSQKLERGARLISVLGMGGIGKTRLVTRFAWSWLGDFPGGVWFCDLSQVHSVDGVVFAVAQGLDVPLGKADPVAQLAHAIAARGKCLVILDNFEQVVRYAEETLGCWLDGASQAQFIVTTREVLGIAGEEALALAPLSIGDGASLFLNRAKSACQEFSPGPDDLEAIGKLANVLDGLPLAIELAAARTRVMTPRTLLAHMRERFNVLGSRSGRHDRQATLRTAFDWSWELLSEMEKAALAQLSVFEGGFTLDSAAAVIALPAIANAPWAVDIVQSLVDKSFVRQVANDRFDFLVSVREYVAEHLCTEGRFPGSGPPALMAAEERHGKHYAKFGPKRATENACVDVDNLVVACRRAVSRGDADTAAHTLAGAWGALKLRGPFRVGIEMSSLVQSIEILSPAVAAVVHRISGSALMLSGRTVEARLQFELAIAKTVSIADLGLLPLILANLAELSMREGRVNEAVEDFQRALLGSPEVADPAFECGTLSGLGTCYEYLGRLDDAQEYYARALKVARERGERRWEGGALGNLGQLSANRGRVAQAQEFYESAMAIAHELGDRQWQGNVSCNLGLLQHGEGRLDEAIGHLDAALHFARELGHARLECIALCNLGIVLEARGEPDSAQQHFVNAVDLARNLGDRRSEGQFLGYLGLLHARQMRFDQSDVCMEAGAKLLRAVADRVSLGVLLCASVEAAHLSGNLGRAEELLNEVERMVQEVRPEPKSEFDIALTRARSLHSESKYPAGVA